MITEIPFREYLALDRVSSHRLWTILDSPLHMRWEVDHPKPPNGSLQQGTILHALMPGADEKIAVQPKTANKKSNEGKSNLVAWLEEITSHIAPRPPTELQSKSAQFDFQIQALDAILQTSDILVATREQYETALRMRDSIMSKSIARVIFEDGKAEQTCLQEDPDTGLPLKARFDWLPSKYRIVADTKSARSTKRSQFNAQVFELGYHLQAAFYRWVYELEFGERPVFYWVAVENTPPYDSAIFDADDKLMKRGHVDFCAALVRYEKCTRMNFWPGRDWNWDNDEYTIQTLTTPRWAQ